MKLVCALAFYRMCVIAVTMHVCIRNKIWSRVPEAAIMVNDKSSDEYLFTDDDIPTQGRLHFSTARFSTDYFACAETNHAKNNLC